MNLTISRDVLNNVFTTTIQFASFGDLNLDSTTESTLLKDFPINLNYSDITFTGKYNISATGNNIISDTTTGDTVTVLVPKRIIPVDENFKITYSISLSQIQTTELGTKITTLDQMGRAKCQCFEDCIKAQLTTLINALKLKQSDFTSVNPINIMV